MKALERLAGVPLVGGLIRYRFIKFGAVGAFGVLVNLAMLYLAKEFLFNAIPWPKVSLNLSLAFAIFCSTFSNFTWNRLWTWSDRKAHRAGKPLPVQFGQYALACWVGIALQFMFTNILAAFLYYLAANLVAIVIASSFNYVVNDLWTFRRHATAAPRGDDEP
jgi:dolichol-phosphate mannosyltransferase